jgi:hypothetical protein
MIVKQIDLLYARIVQWRDESQLWLDELRMLPPTCGTETGTISVFERKVPCQFQAMIGPHGEELLAHEQQLKAYEEAMRQHIRGVGVVPIEWLIEISPQLFEQHARLRAQHAKLIVLVQALTHAATARNELQEQTQTHPRDGGAERVFARDATIAP